MKEQAQREEPQEDTVTANRADRPKGYLRKEEEMRSDGLLLRAEGKGDHVIKTTGPGRGVMTEERRATRRRQVRHGSSSSNRVVKRQNYALYISESFLETIMTFNSDQCELAWGCWVFCKLKTVNKPLYT